MIIVCIKKETGNDMNENKTVIQQAVEVAEEILQIIPPEESEDWAWEEFLLVSEKLPFDFTDEYLKKIFKRAQCGEWEDSVDLTKEQSLEKFPEDYYSDDSYPPSLSHFDLMTKEFPQARFTVNPFFESGTVNMISAPPNSYKSWVLFDIAKNVVSGTLLFGQFETEKAVVMIVNEEDSQRLVQDRLKLLNITDTSLPIYYRIAHGAKLTDDFIDCLLDEAKEKDIKVIMFDSLRSIHEANENESNEMQKVMDLLKKIARHNITVIFTHHNRKKAMFGKGDDAESTRGSSAINAAVSGHISLEEAVNEDGKYLIIKHLKSKIGEKHPPFEVGVTNDDHMSFSYLGEHSKQEKLMNDVKVKILDTLKGREELLTKKDFLHLEIAGESTIKKALSVLRNEGLVDALERKEADRLGLKCFGTGKSNELLYSLKSESRDFLFDKKDEKEFPDSDVYNDLWHADA